MAGGMVGMPARRLTRIVPDKDGYLLLYVCLCGETFRTERDATVQPCCVEWLKKREQEEAEREAYNDEFWPE